MKTVYQCELCNKLHGSYGEAHKCETEHIEIDGAKVAIYCEDAHMPHSIVVGGRYWDESNNAYVCMYGVYKFMSLAPIVTREEQDKLNDIQKREKEYNEKVVRLVNQMRAELEAAGQEIESEYYWSMKKQYEKHFDKKVEEV
jgi:hypothetical protein